MKNTFHGYYRPSDQEFQELWNNCIFVFDTNVLLNFYRYSQKTREELLQVLETLKERLWLPHQVGLEFHRRRLTVISSEVDNYDSLKKKLDEIKKILESNVQHPFVSDDNVKKFNELSESIQKELDDGELEHAKLLSNDPLLHKLTELFEGRVGNEFSEEEIKKLMKEGDERFSQKIPPGYKDANKDSNEYGDLILWKQMIEKASVHKKGVVFVTSEKKEDWWYKHKGKTIGPRPELLFEMKTQADSDFYLYQTDQFVKYSNKYLKQNVSPDAIEEVTKLKKSVSKKSWESEFEKEMNPQEYACKSLVVSGDATEVADFLEILQSNSKYFVVMIVQTEFYAALNVRLHKIDEYAFLREVKRWERFFRLEIELSDVPIVKV